MQPFPHICTHCRSFIHSAVLPLSMDKIKKAITQMKSDSTSGKDGILAEVYNAAGNLCCIALQWWLLPNMQEFLRKIWQFIPCLHLLFFFFFFFFTGDQLRHTNSVPQARISPPWLSELRWLWQSSLTSWKSAHFPCRFQYYTRTA